MQKIKLFIASDHGGLELKEKIEYHYDIETSDPDAAQVAIVDLGPQDLNPDDDYPQFAFQLAQTVVQEQSSEEELILGVLICRSGVGMSIAANKVKGCYAALCAYPEQASKAREHNHANVLVIDADYGDEVTHLQIVHNFLHAKPQGERHERRVNQIIAFEQTQAWAPSKFIQQS